MKLGIEGTYLNITKTISSKVESKTRVSTLLTLTQHSFGIPSQINKTKEEIKGVQIGKEEVKLSLFADITRSYTKRSRKVYQKTYRHNTHFQKNSRLCNQCTKIRNFHIYQN
jgi:hypothetical protein